MALQKDGEKGMILCVFALVCLLAAALTRAPVYGKFMEGARQGLKTAWHILPALVTMLAAVKALEYSGFTAGLCALLAPLTEKAGLPADVLPLMLVRPLSGSGALAVLEDLMERFGPDSREAFLGSVMVGSSETVFYTCSVYLAAAGVKDGRHTVPCALFACLCGYGGALLFCR